MRHVLGGTPVQQRDADLVAGHRDSFGQQYAQVRCVEVGQTDMGDQPFLAQAGEFEHRVDVAWMVEGPPVELQQVYAFNTHPVERALHACTYRGRGHQARWRAPFGEGPHTAGPGAREQLAGNQLCRTVMVGHVETVKACRHVVGHCR